MVGIARTRNAAGDRCVSLGTPMRRRAGQSGDQLVNVMIVIVIAASIGFIGTDVNDSINESIEFDDRPNNTFADAQDNITGGYADAMGLSDIVFIVLMFGVILSVLLAFRLR